MKIKSNILLINLSLCFFLSFVGIGNCKAASFDEAKWISIDTTLQKENQWICFRKTISVKQIPASTKMSIAVDSKYWLWINEKLVVFEGGLKRGPNPEDTYYDVVDISKYLKKGENTIAILMWYWGKDGYCHKSSGKSGLIAQISSTSQPIVTDGSWKVMVHPSFGETGLPKPNYRLPEANVYFDARKDIGKWKAPDYDDSQWMNSVEMGAYPCAPWNELHVRPFPNWKDSGIMKYKAVNKEVIGNNLVVTALLSHNITVTPYLKVEAKGGELIDIRSDNYKGGSEYNVRAEYVTKKGVQTFEMPNYVNGHSILYTMPKGVKVIEVGYRETSFNTEHIGRFECNDDFYNKLWQKSLHTMNLNMRDAIQDPDRERSQWWGDVAIILHEILYSCDTRGHAAVQKAILNLVDWQKKDGTLYSPVPAGAWHGELPLQMLASIGKYGFWSYYWHTKDISCLEYIYPSVKRYLSLWQIDENGLVKHRSGGWDWADWGENIDVYILDNAWYCLALESVIRMGELLGDGLFVANYKSQLELVKQSAAKAFWNGEVFRSASYRGKTDDRANGMAVLAGWADEDKNRKVVDFLMSNEGASPYMEKYILESLLSMGYISEGLGRMKKRYENMVNSPLTTLWEDWAVGGAGGGSINHGWSGGSLSLLPQYIAGIYPTTAGWDEFVIKPQLGFLEWIKCDVPVFGKLVKIKVDKAGTDKWNLSVDNQTGKVCMIGLPKDFIKSHIVINKLKIACDKNRIESNPILKLISQDNQFLYVQLKVNKADINL